MMTLLCSASTTTRKKQNPPESHQLKWLCESHWICTKKSTVVPFLYLSDLNTNDRISHVNQVVPSSFDNLCRENVSTDSSDTSILIKWIVLNNFIPFVGKHEQSPSLLTRSLEETKTLYSTSKLEHTRADVTWRRVMSSWKIAKKSLILDGIRKSSASIHNDSEKVINFPKILKNDQSDDEVKSTVKRTRNSKKRLMHNKVL